jgi:hypothetical protein
MSTLAAIFEPFEASYSAGMRSLRLMLSTQNLRPWMLAWTCKWWSTQAWTPLHQAGLTAGELLVAGRCLLLLLQKLQYVGTMFDLLCGCSLHLPYHILLAPAS